MSSAGLLDNLPPRALLVHCNYTLVDLIHVPLHWNLASLVTLFVGSPALPLGQHACPTVRFNHNPVCFLLKPTAPVARTTLRVHLTVCLSFLINVDLDFTDNLPHGVPPRRPACSTFQDRHACFTNSTTFMSSV